MARMERVLLGRLAAAGLTPGTVSALLRSRRHGRAETALRVLEDAAGAAIRQADPRYAGSPVEEPILAATLPIGQGLAWRAGELLDPRGVLPRTLAHGVAGEPIGRLLSHPDVSPDATTSPARSPRGVVAIEPESVAPPAPTLPERIAALRLRVLRRRAEKPIARGTTVLLALPALLAAARLADLPTYTRDAPGRALEIASVATLILAVSVFGVLAIDSLTRHRLSEAFIRGTTMHEDRARRRHAERLLDLAGERGFDDDGEPV